MTHPHVHRIYPLTHPSDSSIIAHYRCAMTPQVTVVWGEMPTLHTQEHQHKRASEIRVVHTLHSVTLRLKLR